MTFIPMIEEIKPTNKHTSKLVESECLNNEDVLKFPDNKIDERGTLRNLNTRANLKALLSHVGYCSSVNTMTLEPELTDIRTGLQSTVSRSVINSALISATQHYGLPKSVVEDHFNALCEQKKVHPVKAWLEKGNSLKGDVWDKIERVDPVISCLKTKDDALTNKILKRWLVGCVASLYEANFKSKLVPILQGEQSYRKTAFIERLATVCPYAFLEGAELNPDSKDSVLSCIRSWIVELGELERTNRNSQGSLKAFITKDIDTVRPPYARSDIKKPRQTHFIATVNGTDFLKDDTGSSRFFVVEMLAPADMDKLNLILGWHYDGTGKRELKEPEELHQFWLEVKELYLNGYGWQMSDDEINIAQVANQSFNDKGTWYEYIRDNYIANHQHSTVKQWLTAGQLVAQDSNMNGVNTKQIGIALSKLHSDGLIERKEGRSRTKLYCFNDTCGA